MIDLAQLTGIYKILCGNGCGVIYTSQLDVQHLAIVLAGLVHGDCIGKGPCHGLHAVAVFTGTKYIKDLGKVQVVMNRYIHSVDIVSLQHLTIV